VGEFGEKFRKERERRGLTLDDVSNVTKINSRMLKAIETEHFDQLPGGVFNKGFVRAYAKHLGLNDEDAITEYLAVLREAQIGAQTAEWPSGHRPEPHSASESRSGMPPPKSPSVERKAVERETKSAVADTPVEPPEFAALPPRQHEAPMFGAATVAAHERQEKGLPWKTAVVVLAMVVAAAALWGRRSHNGQAGQTTPSRQDQNTAQATPPAAVPSGAHPTSVDPKAGGMAAASRPASPGGVSTSPSPSPDPKPGVQSGVIATKQSRSSADDVAPRPSVSSHAATESAKAPATFTLVIRATKTSWISVEADGQLINQETLIAPAHTSARASREIVVKAGNAAGVSFLLNGKEIPAQGDDGEVKTYLFDREGMRTIAPGQAPDSNR
jgi:cytoskeletal protein RodZ